MQMKSSGNKCSITSINLRVIFLAVMVFILIAPVASADRYITFTDGRLHVFPSACILSIKTDNDVITITDRKGGTYTYSLSTISSIETQLTKALPTFKTYLFDNKYNYQVPIGAN